MMHLCICAVIFCGDLHIQNNFNSWLHVTRNKSQMLLWFAVRPSKRLIVTQALRLYVTSAYPDVKTQHPRFYYQRWGLFLEEYE